MSEKTTFRLATAVLSAAITAHAAQGTATPARLGPTDKPGSATPGADASSGKDFHIYHGGHGPYEETKPPDEKWLQESTNAYLAAFRANQTEQANRIAADMQSARERIMASLSFRSAMSSQAASAEEKRMSEALDRSFRSLFPDPAPGERPGEIIYAQRTITAGGDVDLLFDSGLNAWIVNARGQPDIYGGILRLEYSKFRKKNIRVKTSQSGYNTDMKPGETKWITLPIYRGPKPQPTAETIEVEYWAQGK